MKIEKLNELAYVFRFGSDIEAKRIFTFCTSHVKPVVKEIPLYVRIAKY